MKKKYCKKPNKCTSSWSSCNTSFSCFLQVLFILLPTLFIASITSSGGTADRILLHMKSVLNFRQADKRVLHLPLHLQNLFLPDSTVSSMALMGRSKTSAESNVSKNNFLFKKDTRYKSNSYRSSSMRTLRTDHYRSKNIKDGTHLFNSPFLQLNYNLCKSTNCKKLNYSS